MSPDTQQNLLYTIYFIFLHNFEAILYSFGIIGATAWAFYKPTRGKLLMIWGFIILLFAFEYDKHILEPLKEQTIQSLVTQRESPRIVHIIDKVLVRIVPKALPLLGWLLVIMGLAWKKITGQFGFKEV